MATRTTAERVQHLYGQPGLESWRQVGRILRVPSGTAWGLAHGLYEARPETLAQIELLEWRMNQFPQAIAALARLIGREPVLPVVFGRARTRKLRKQERSHV